MGSGKNWRGLLMLAAGGVISGVGIGEVWLDLFLLLIDPTGQPTPLFRLPNGFVTLVLAATLVFVYAGLRYRPVWLPASLFFLIFLSQLMCWICVELTERPYRKNESGTLPFLVFGSFLHALGVSISFVSIIFCVVVYSLRRSAGLNPRFDFENPKPVPANRAVQPWSRVQSLASTPMDQQARLMKLDKLLEEKRKSLEDEKKSQNTHSISHKPTPIEHPFLGSPIPSLPERQCAAFNPEDSTVAGHFIPLEIIDDTPRKMSEQFVPPRNFEQQKAPVAKIQEPPLEDQPQLKPEHQSTMIEQPALIQDSRNPLENQPPLNQDYRMQREGQLPIEQAYRNQNDSHQPLNPEYRIRREGLIPANQESRSQNEDGEPLNEDYRNQDGGQLTLTQEYSNQSASMPPLNQDQTPVIQDAVLPHGTPPKWKYVSPDAIKTVQPMIDSDSSSESESEFFTTAAYI